MKFLKWFRKQKFRDDAVGDEARNYNKHYKKHGDYPVHKPNTMKLFKAIEDAPDPVTLKKAIIEYKAYSNIVKAQKQYMKTFNITELPKEKIKEEELKVYLYDGSPNKLKK